MKKRTPSKSITKSIKSSLKKRTPSKSITKSKKSSLKKRTPSKKVTTPSKAKKSASKSKAKKSTTKKSTTKKSTAKKSTSKKSATKRTTSRSVSKSRTTNIVHDVTVELDDILNTNTSLSARKVAPCRSRSRSRSVKRSVSKSQSRKTSNKKRTPKKSSVSGSRKFFTVSEDAAILKFLSKNPEVKISKVAATLADQLCRTTETIRDRIRKYLTKLSSQDQKKITSACKVPFPFLTP